MLIHEIFISNVEGCELKLMSANKHCFYFQELPQFIRDSDQSHFGGSDVDLLAGADELVTLRSLQELLGSYFTKQLLWGTRSAMDLLQ